MMMLVTLNLPFTVHPLPPPKKLVIYYLCSHLLGPCTAAIVGHKSKRYSIFGESVKMVSGMSRTGEGKLSFLRLSKKVQYKLLIKI